MQYFNFSRLIKKYMCNFTAITLSNGYYNDAGDWVQDTVLTPLIGAIISQSESKILRSEGALTEKDKQLFMLEPVDDTLHGAKVIYKDNVYDLTNSIENADFTGVYVYTLKYVSAFKDVAAKYDLTEKLESLEKRLNGIVEEAEVVIEDNTSLADKVESMERKIESLEGEMNDSE